MEMEISDETLAMEQIKLILSEKRTSLSFMRTGIAFLALPLSVLSALIATSRYYEIEKVLHFIIPLLFLSAFMIVAGLFLIVRAFIKIRRYDSLIEDIKRRHDFLNELLEE